MRTRQRILLWLLPTLVLLSALACIGMRHRTLWLWNVVVHEDGERTLLRTILYFEHALGELPLEILLAAGAAGAAGTFFGLRPAPRLGRLRWAMMSAAVTVDLLIGLGAWVSVGPSGAATWLLQYHTRNGAPLRFGSHWQYHLLSEAALMLWVAVLVRMFVLPGPAGFVSCRNRNLLLAGSWIAFAGAAVLFGTGADPFLDARYLGHQARETFTHALVTAPLAVGLCLALAQPLKGGASCSQRRFWVQTAGLVLGCCLLVAYQGLGVALTGAQRQAQTQDWVKLVCGHFFEHTLSYVVVPLHTAAFFLLAPGDREGRR